MRGNAKLILLRLDRRIVRHAERKLAFSKRGVEKVRWHLERYSAYRHQAAPKGIDVYFDNVGGDILEACLSLMNNRGRIACCGAISQYDGVPSAHGPRGVPGLIVVKRLIMQGFIVMDYMDQSAAALKDLQSWVASGQLKVKEDVIDGIENTPQALIGLLAGENRGKRMVRV